MSSEQPDDDWADASESFENVSADFENGPEMHEHNFSAEESTVREVLPV